jgi:pyruvate dehydrogenase complex dehydrogenase (E1) component
VVVAVLSALCAQGEVKPETVSAAIQRFGIDPEAADPRNL